jgi:hypothetical protein
MLDVSKLLGLSPGWDGYDGKVPTPAALAAARRMTCVPLSNGGLQIELHAEGASVEIAITPQGVIADVNVTPVR